MDNVEKNISKNNLDLEKGVVSNYHQENNLVSAENISSLTDKERDTFLKETQNEIGNLNSINAETEDVNNLELETGIKENLQNLDNEAITLTEAVEQIAKEASLEKIPLQDQIDLEAEQIEIKPEDRNEKGQLLVSPGGQPSSLPEKEWKMARTAAFKKWFGEWDNPSKLKDSSKVVDINGEPMLVYHSTTENFNKFGEGFTNAFYFSVHSQAFPASKIVNEAVDLILNSLQGKFRLSKKKACFLSIKNPYIADKASFESGQKQRSQHLGNKKEVINGMKAKGHDGIFGLHAENLDKGIFRKTNGIAIDYAKEYGTVYSIDAEMIAFDPEQVLISRQDVGPGGDLHKNLRKVS